MSQGTDNFHANTFLTCRCLFCSPCNVVYNTILRLKCVKNYHVIFPHMDRKYMIKPTPLSRQKLDHVTKYKLQKLTVINTSIILILHLRHNIFAPLYLIVKSLISLKKMMKRFNAVEVANMFQTGS